MTLREQILRAIDDYRDKGRPRLAYLYVVQHRDGPVKVGVAGNPALRLRDLQCANPYPLVTLALLYVPQSVERVVHRHLRPHRLHGEWFDVPAGELTQLLSVLSDETLDLRLREMEVV